MMLRIQEIITLARASKLVDFDAWHGRIVVWLAAITAGFVVVMFAKATEYAINYFFVWHFIYNLITCCR